MTRNDINIIRTYLANQPVGKAWIFGSVARGEQTENSDIDILVTFDDNVTLFKYSSMVRDLHRLLNKEIDMVSETSLLPWVKDTIDHDKILIYERKTT